MVRPVKELVAGTWRVSVMKALVGVKVTVMVQVAEGVRVLQVVLEEKLGVALLGVAIWRVAELVLVRVMVCCVAIGPGTFEKVRAAGVRERPESGLPKPVRREVTGVEDVGMVRVPVSGPVVVGVKMMLRKQEALGARSPVQVWPPVG